ncbi:hypothetical protein [Neptuniibacter sp. 1_MG-2023]|uniref:hypothetical protein n=1 Tax=Neptuniibacter sp. 1_MG-2023 TaxID=3062662 RepID=UPI0026E2878B|nr:hypothetical protein [Neptuniibacter sp. 1_MG-2023]MDO6594782.1 hypothetical protein [Neptuniibacter sp. 1_MG-2023]
MRHLFKADPLANAYKAILADDKEKLLKYLRKIKPSDIDKLSSDTTPGLVEACIIQQRPHLLTLILEQGASATGKTVNDHPFGILSIKQEASLRLLTALLSAGNNEDRDQLLAACFEYSQPTQLMLHISLLIQHGAEIKESIVIKALKMGDRPLIHFLINSGAVLPKQVDMDEIDEETLTYANKCAEDLQIRRMFL